MFYIMVDNYKKYNNLFMNKIINDNYKQMLKR